MTAFVQYESDDTEAFLIIDNGYAKRINLLTLAGKPIRTIELPANYPVRVAEDLLKDDGYMCVSRRYEHGDPFKVVVKK